MTLLTCFLPVVYKLNFLYFRDGKRSRRNTFRSNSTCGVSSSEQAGQRSSEPIKESVIQVDRNLKVGEPSLSMGDKKSSLESKSVSWSNSDNKCRSSPGKLSQKSSQESDSGPEVERERRKITSTEEFQLKRDNPSIPTECQGASSTEGIHTSASAVDILSADNIAMEKLESEIPFHLETPHTTDGQIVMLNSDGDVDYELTETLNPENSIRKREEGSEEEKERQNLPKIEKSSSSSDFRGEMSEGEETKSPGPRVDQLSPTYSKDLKKESESDSERAESDLDVRSFQGVRRRKTRLDDSSESGASYCRPRRQIKDNKTNRKERELTPNLERDDCNKV